jgi:hypothetical protein
LRRRAALAAPLFVVAAAVHAGAVSKRFCGDAPPLSAAQQDIKLRFADIAKRELEASGARLAIVARSGLNLERFAIRYSHGGISLKASDNGAWSVRQLYYACDEARPRLFDQGMAGFVSGTDDPNNGYLSIMMLPPEAERALEAAALDRARALALVAGRYSANAYPYSTRYQNCNQWLAELMAAAWSSALVASREDAQRWLAAQRYEPGVVDVGNPLWLVAAAFVPWIYSDDQPPEEIAAARYRTSLPSSIEAFVRVQWPQAERIELCHDAQRVVVRRGWTPIAAGCAGGEGDRVIALGG